MNMNLFSLPPKLLVNCFDTLLSPVLVLILPLLHWEMVIDQRSHCIETSRVQTALSSCPGAIGCTLLGISEYFVYQNGSKVLPRISFTFQDSHKVWTQSYCLQTIISKSSHLFQYGW